MCDGRCHCCCCRRHDEAGDGIGGLLVLLLAALGLTVYAAYWLGLMVVEWLSAAASVVSEYQTEILCVVLGTILIDLCLVARRFAAHVAKLPLRRLPAALRSTRVADARHGLGRATFRPVAGSLGRSLQTVEAAERSREGELLRVASRAPQTRR
jgi:hypothetical protein